MPMPQDISADTAPDVAAILRALCAEQAAHWLARPLAAAEAAAAFARMAATDPDIFLLTVQSGNASLAEKPAEARRESYPTWLDRAETCRRLLAEAARQICPTLSTTLAVSVGDAAPPAPDAPVFAFRKPPGNACLLLPDLDLLDNGFFADTSHDDPQPYAEKRVSAVFQGAISARRVPDDLGRRLAVPPLRAASYFRDHAAVTFRVATADPFEPEATLARLQALGLGETAQMPWPEQLRHRFLIVMDGAGASGERFARALRSNCVPLRYPPALRLHYFSALQPWLQYVPVDQDEDVEAILAIEQAQPGFFAPVAAAGRAFVQRLLTRAAAVRYTGELLQMYARCLTEPVVVTTEQLPEGFDLLAHVRNRGDMRFGPNDWAGERGSENWIEGFCLDPLPGFPAGNVSYRVVQHDGFLSDWMTAGEFCGTRGQTQPLQGFAISLSGEAARRLHCLYIAQFMDGTEVGPVVADEICRAPSRAVLVAMRVLLFPRGD
jgi:hypothetical protein